MTVNYFHRLDGKYLLSGPAPLGRILNYIKRIKLSQYSSSIRGPRGGSANNLDDWTVCFMVGLGLIDKPTYSPTLRLSLTAKGEVIYSMIRGMPDFPDHERRAKRETLDTKTGLVSNNPKLYDKLREVFLESDSIKNLGLFLKDKGLDKINRWKLYQEYGSIFGIKRAGFNRIPSSLQIAQFCNLLEEHGASVYIYDKDYIKDFTINNSIETVKDIVKEDLEKEEKTKTLDVDEKKFLEDISINLIPERKAVVLKLIKRNSRIVKRLKKLYDGKCQICGYTFRKRDGSNYCEGNHLIPLGEKGSDSIANLTILCSNCHSEMTYANVEIGNLIGNKRLIKINGIQKEIEYKSLHLKAVREADIPA